MVPRVRLARGCVLSEKRVLELVRPAWGAASKIVFLESNVSFIKNYAERISAVISSHTKSKFLQIISFADEGGIQERKGTRQKQPLTEGEAWNKGQPAWSCRNSAIKMTTNAPAKMAGMLRGPSQSSGKKWERRRN